MKLRYYAPAYGIHSEILSLLNQIKEKHGIEYEIVEVSEEHEQEIYTKDFKPRAKTLKSRIGESIARALRSRRGGYFVAGTIALVKRNKVEWFPCYSDPFYQIWKSYDREYPIPLGFLKMVLDRGVYPLKEAINRGIESEHDKLVKEFVNSDILLGKFEEEVPVGKAMIVVDKYGEKKEVGKKSIDLVCKTSTETWIIEVEPELNPTALGQILIYANLYNQAPSPIKLGIVCRNADEELLEICKKYVDEVFVLGKIRKKS